MPTISRAKYITRWTRLLKLNEVYLRVEYAAARKRLLVDAAKNYTEKQDIPAFVYSDYEGRLNNALASTYRRVFPQFRGLAITQIDSFSKKSADTLFEALAIEWIARNALAKAQQIAATDADLIRDTLSAGFDAGDGVESMAGRINGMTSQTPYRAATIARTEIHAAAIYAAMETAREASRDLGIEMLKEWGSVTDHRTRDDHIAADGQTVALDEKFNVGGEMLDAPGDPAGSAGTVINCRCAIIHKEKLPDDF